MKCCVKTCGTNYNLSLLICVIPRTALTYPMPFVHPPTHPSTTPATLQCLCSSTGDVPDRKGLGSCTMACSGDASQICGGANSISVYKYTPDGGPTATPSPMTPEPVSPTGSGAYTSEGCKADSETSRVLTGGLVKNNSGTTTEVRHDVKRGPRFNTHKGSVARW